LRSEAWGNTGNCRLVTFKLQQAADVRTDPASSECRFERPREPVAEESRRELLLSRSATSREIVASTRENLEG
jgi:hypothetical protein